MGASNHPDLALPKPPPRVIGRKAKQRAVKRMDRIEKEKVRARDKESCRVCFRSSREVHERLFKSLGGIACLANSMVACRVCHEYLQGHAIEPIGPDCNSPLTFEMAQAVAHAIFRGRAVPPHVVVIASKESQPGVLDR